MKLPFQKTKWQKNLKNQQLKDFSHAVFRVNVTMICSVDDLVVAANELVMDVKPLLPVR